MSSRIHAALSELSASVERLDRALVMSSERRNQAQPDLFSSAIQKEASLPVVTTLNGKVIDAARMARAVDRAIEKVERLLQEG